MVKLVFCCWRRPDITAARYAELLLRGHVPLALRHHPTLRRYVVNLVEETRPGMRLLDSIGELSFDGLADFHERLYDSDDGRRIVERDVAGFMGGAHAYVTTAYVQKAPATPPIAGARTPGVKLVAPVRRRAELTHAQFVDHWLGRHVPLALTHHPGLVGYVTNVVDGTLGADAEPFDGIAELHFASVDALATQMFASPESERIIREDMARFIGWTNAWRVAEYPQRL